MIKWKSDVFKHLNNFDIVTMDEIIDMYKKQYEHLIDDGYEPTHKDDKFGYKIVKDKMFEKIKFNGLGLRKGNNRIQLDLSNKTHRYGKDYLNYLFYIVPNHILKKQTSHLWQPNLDILNKFFNEVDWDGDWKTLMDEYDKRYPQKHITNKQEGEFSWRANFSIDWFLSIRNDGIISPLVLNSTEKLFNRGSHRCFNIGQCGYDLPLFIPMRLVNKKGKAPITISTESYFDDSLELHINNPYDNPKVIWYHKKIIEKD